MTGAGFQETKQLPCLPNDFQSNTELKARSNYLGIIMELLTSYIQHFLMIGFGLFSAGRKLVHHRQFKLLSRDLGAIFPTYRGVNFF